MTGNHNQAAEKPTAEIHLALCFDDNFWAPAFATMRSVCLATRRRKDLVFHLFHRELTPAHHADLEKIATEFGASLVYYNIDRMPLFADIAGRARYNRRLSNIVYARLLFGELLPASVARLIYLDCDVYVRGPVEELAEMDLCGKSVGAVRDSLYPFVSNGRDLLHNRDLFDPAEPYFNAGMLVIDMAGWRAADILGRLEAAIADGTMDRIYYDQDFLNLVFRGNWHELDPLWNVIDPRHAHQALNPHLLHYTDKRKPWMLLSFVAFARAYRHVMTNEIFYDYLRHRTRNRIAKWLKLKK